MYHDRGEGGEGVDIIMITFIHEDDVNPIKIFKHELFFIIIILKS